MDGKIKLKGIVPMTTEEKAEAVRNLDEINLRTALVNEVQWQSQIAEMQKRRYEVYYG